MGETSALLMQGRGRSPHAMGLDAACALEWLAAIRRPFHTLAEHNLDAIVCFDNQHADLFALHKEIIQ